MLIKQIDVKEIPERLEEFLTQISSGVEYVLIDGKTPVARIVPISMRVADLHAGAIWTSSNFDEPLPDEFWVGNE